MDSLFVILIPIAVTDVMNPVLFAAVTYTLGTEKPFSNALSLLFAYFASYYLGGIFLALGLDAVLDVLKNPKPVDYLIGICVGVLLLIVAIHLWWPKAERKGREFKEPETISVITAFLIGVQVNLFGLPFALPYFAAIDQILKADLETLPALLVLLYYNTLYILPFAALVAVRALFRRKSDRIFERINAVINKIGSVLMPVLLLLLGGLLVADGVGFFLGRPILPTG
jgi:cytochrome c biogenesis protein CcdA